MYNNKIYSRLKFSILVLVVLTTQSCIVTEKSTYFNDIPDSSTVHQLLPAVFQEPVIQPDDILSIVIQTIDPQNTTSVNQMPSVPAVGASSASPTGSQVVSGFLVDKDGKVFIPMLGSLKLSGLTTYEARKFVEESASRYFKDPTVQVRFANYKITVIGEVARPATYTVPNERVSLLDVLGMAGDLTIFGRRENVLLIRTNGVKKDFVRFNLNSSDIFKSPYFYLRQNDVIYVEPGKGKVAANNAARTQTLAIIASGLTVLIALISRL